MYVYIITNLINNKKYIGLSTNKKKSLRKTYYGSGKLIKKAIEKYGKNNFTKEIVKEFENEKDCREYERYLIQESNAVQSELYYNLAPGGYGGSSKGRILSEEQKQRMRTLNLGKKRNKEACYNISISKMGIKQSIESRDKKSISMKKYHENLSDDNKQLINNKISIALTGKITKNETKEKLSRFNAKHSDEVVIEIFYMIKDKVPYSKISKIYGISPSQITSIKNKKTYKWVLDNLE